MCVCVYVWISKTLARVALGVLGGDSLGHRCGVIRFVETTSLGGGHKSDARREVDIRKCEALHISSSWTSRTRVTRHCARRVRAVVGPRVLEGTCPGPFRGQRRKGEPPLGHPRDYAWTLLLCACPKLATAAARVDEALHFAFAAMCEGEEVRWQRSTLFLYTHTTKTQQKGRGQARLRSKLSEARPLDVRQAPSLSGASRSRDGWRAPQSTAVAAASVLTTSPAPTALASTTDRRR